MRYIYLIILLICTTTGHAIEWFDGTNPVSYSIKGKVSPVVTIALNMFCDDIKAVTGKSAIETKNGKNNTIEIYQLDKSAVSSLSQLRKDGIPVDRIRNELDCFYIGVKRGHIIIVGNNGRGCAYGILELSRHAGVSPWVWWGDVTPERKSRLELSDEFTTCQSPSVSYRGIFLNDEDWSTRNWAGVNNESDLTYGTIGPKTYKRIFQLLLRLRANAIWPGMHEGTEAFFKVKGNREIADSCGILIGSSHCEPILRNNVGEWNEKQRGKYNFITNQKAVEEYWAERLKEVKGGEYLFTIGMRGIHDGSMEGVKTREEKLKGLQGVIDSQRELIKKHFNSKVEQVPQVFIPYKEVLEIYEDGLKVPDDVTLMWCDDNYGYMTRLSDTEQQKRSGGAGVYYHLSYWGRPHDYLWLTTTQPGLIYSEMRQAYDNNARKLWIANVHDPKVAAYDLELFLDMAWNIDAISHDNLTQHLQKWLTTQFGSAAGKELLPVMREFYHLCAIRRPEFMGWTQVELDRNRYPRGRSQVIDTEFTNAFGDELNRHLANYQHLCDEIERIETTIPSRLRDAYFAAVKYPVFGAALMTKKMLEAQKARALCMGESTNKMNTRKEALVTASAKSLGAYYKIRELTDYYNNKLAEGKWRGSMSCMPRDLNVFNGPILPFVPTEAEIKQYDCAGKASYPIKTDDVIALNAADYTKATEGTRTIEMLGHSMKAVSLPKGGSISFDVELTSNFDGVLRTATIPTQSNDKGDIRYSVSIDGDTPEIYSLKEPYRSDRWKENVLRGQALRTTDVKLKAGKHTITITALDNHIIVDQLMLDNQKSRKFYVFPCE